VRPAAAAKEGWKGRRGEGEKDGMGEVTIMSRY